MVFASLVDAWATALPATGESTPSGESTPWWKTIIEWFHDPETLLIAMGPWVLLGVAAIVFIESGVLFPILPGDSLLFAAGLLHGQLGLNMWVLVGVILVTAFLGAQVGYFIGLKWGRRLFKDDARVLKTEYLHQAEAFFVKYGGHSLVIGRFVPFVRTFVPLAAGISRYHYPKFLLYNTLGALLWGVGVTCAGVLLGNFAFVHDNLSVIIILIVLVSVLPMAVEIWNQQRKAKKAKAEQETAGKVTSEVAGRVATGKIVPLKPAGDEVATSEAVTTAIPTSEAIADDK